MDQKALKDLIRKQSYKEGNFTLASGKKSPYYINLKNSTLDPEGIHGIGDAMADWVLNKPNLEKIEAVAGLTLGADPLVTALSMKLFERGRRVVALIVRKEPKGHGTGQWIEGLELVRPGADVLVLEDVVTTGGSGLKAIERVRLAGLNPVGVLAVVDRQEGGAEAFSSTQVPFHSLFTIQDFIGV